MATERHRNLVLSKWGFVVCEDTVRVESSRQIVGLDTGIGHDDELVVGKIESLTTASFSKWFQYTC